MIVLFLRWFFASQDDPIVILHCHGTINTNNNSDNDPFKVTTYTDINNQ